MGATSDFLQVTEKRHAVMTHVADKDVTNRLGGLWECFRGGFCRAVSYCTPVLELPGWLLLQGPRGTGLPECLSPHILVPVPPFLLTELSSWSFACTPCLPSLPNLPMYTCSFASYLFQEAHGIAPLTCAGKFSILAQLPTPALSLPVQF